MRGFHHQRDGFRSKPKRYRTDRNRNAHVTTSSVQHGFWALKIEVIAKPNYVHDEIESIEPRPTLKYHNLTVSMV